MPRECNASSVTRFFRSNLAALAIWAGLGSACSASVSGKVSTADDVEGATAEENAAPADAKAFAALEDPDFNEAPESARVGEAALLGARHDLYLKGNGRVVCGCMQATAGPAYTPGLVWDATVPRLDLDSQVALAISDGADCAGAPTGAEGASYRGYQQQGNDVIVLLEAARAGKPQVSGAVVPKPVAGGRLILSPFKPDLPYGRGEDEKGCVVLGAAEPEKTDGRAVATQRRIAPAPASDSKSLTRVDVQRTELDKPSFEDINAPEEYNEDEVPSLRDGLLVRASLGLEYLTLKSGGTDPSVDITGLGAGFSLFIGGALSPGSTVGAVLGGSSAENPEASSDTAGLALTGTRLNAFRVGLFGDIYPWETSEFHLGMEVTATRVGFSGRGNPAAPVTGLGLGASLGYDLWLSRHVSLGLMATFQYALLPSHQFSQVLSTAESTMSHLLVPGLALDIAYH